MKKRFFFLLTTALLSIAAFSQSDTASRAKKSPHLTFTLYQNNFYYTKSADKDKIKIELADSSAITAIINAAIAQYKVDKKDLNVHIEGDNLMDHPQFDILLNTILSKTVSEVRIKTNVLE